MYIFSVRALLAGRWRPLSSNVRHACTIHSSGVIVNEDRKLAEAKYFLSHLSPSASNPNHFSFELSAFLSSARSVLQYALEEAKTKQGGQVWYDAQLTSAPEIKYFKDKRNVSIHVRPVEPDRRIVIGETAAVSFGESLAIKVTDSDGNLIEERHVTSSDPSSPPIPPTTTVEVSYHLADWNGPEDVETLCSRYCSAIEAVLIDGQARGFLSR